MAQFPDRMLELIAEAAWGADLTADPDTWDWTELTCSHPVVPNSTISRVLAVPITINKGVAAGASQSQTTSGTVALLNNDGWLTPKLPTSPYSPYVDAGTPFRLSVRDRSDMVDTFTRSAVASSWGTATSGEVWQGANASYSTNGTQGLVTFSAVNAQRNQRINRTERDVEVLFDLSASVVPTGGALNAGPLVRSSGTGAYSLWCPVSFDTSGQIALFVIRNYAASSTTLASTFVPSLTYSAGTMIRCRVRVAGNRIQVRAWLASGSEPSTWHVDYTQTSNIVTGWNGTLAATDIITMRSEVSSAVTSTLPITYTYDNITISQVPSARLEGYISDIRPGFLPGSDGVIRSIVFVDVGGIGTRLEKNQAPSYSPMRRSIQLAAIPPIAYWPLEDDEGSTFGVSAYPGGPRMMVTGPAVFAFAQGTPTETYLSRYGTKPMVSVAAGVRIVGLVPATTVQTEWAVSTVAQCYAPGITPAVSELRILEWATPGCTYQRWALIGTATGYKVRAYQDLTGTTTDVITVATGVFSAQLTFTVEANQNGANIDVELFQNDNSMGTGSIAGTLGQPTQVAGNPDQVNTTASTDPRGLRFILGHVRVVDETSVHDVPYYTVPETGQVVSAIYAWYLEPAHRRLERLCSEERVPFELVGAPGAAGSTILNAQPDGSFTELRDATVESESGGLLWEAGFGYKYLPRAARYNLPVALTVDLSTYRHSGDTDAADVLVPQLDARAANVWAVQRRNGAEGSYAAPVAYRRVRGTIAEQVVVDVLRDEDTTDHAGWRTHLNVDVREALYPGMPVDLAANPGLLDSWLSCDIGSRVQRTNQPTIAGLSTIDQVILGWAETISPTSWQVANNAAPAKVWDVAVVDSVLGKADTDGSVVHTGALAGATSIQVDVTAGPRWTTDPAQMPIPVTADGMDLSVTAISGTSNPQTFTLASGLPRLLIAGTPISLTHPPTAAL